MKKIIAVLLMAVLLVMTTNVLADSLCYRYGQWWVRDDDGYLHSTQSRPLEWKPEKINYNFPMSVVRDQSEACRQYNGIPLNCLGLTSTAGSNLRGTTSVNGKLSYDSNWRQDYNDPTIIKKLHGNVTVFVNFKFYSSNGDEWYHVTCSDGMSGLLLAKRILLFPLSDG